MFSIFYTEMIKLKKTRIFWLVLFAALPACMMSLFALLPRITPEGISAGFDMQDMFYRQGMMLTIIGAPLFALMTGYIVAREYQERTINQLFSYPIPRVRFLVTKLLVVFLLIMITVILSFVFVVGATLLFKHQLNIATIWLGLKMNLLICILSFGTIPVAAALSMVGKNVIPTTVLAVFVTAITLIGEAGHSRSCILFPWLTPYWPVRRLAQGIANNSGPNPYAGPALVILAFTFIISLTFCIVYYIKADVHSGS
ncbi:MAG TPA: ABC transporter permease [Bacillota bacterium]|nr:ABC transporter permease [Bacillota bacterium]